MTCDFRQLPHKGIQSLKPYVPGKSVEALAKEKGLTNIIKLASNENPLGCSNEVNQALASLSGHQIATYPSPLHHPLRDRLSEELGVDKDMIMLSNGSDSLFWFLLTAFALGKNKPIVTHLGAFISYAIQAQTLNIPVVKTTINNDYTIEINAMIAEAKNEPAMIFLANPNNPTGILIPYEQIEHLLEHVPSSTIVVLDEAYHEYAHPQGSQLTIDLQKRYRNLVLTRTFSKIHGLAALRIGYAIADPAITELLIRVQPPFTVNHAALVAAEAALNDADFVDRTIRLNRQGMQQIIEGLKHLNFNALPSLCNFITFNCDNHSQAIYQGLLDQGVIVRPLVAYDMPNHLRVSIGTMEQNERFLRSLEQCLMNSGV